METVKNNFYVYCHQTKDEGKCFYIGKGKGNRAYSKSSRNPHWKYKVSKHGGFDVMILVNNITEEKAFELEENFIRQIGLENLVNMTYGGEGKSGYKASEETRKKQSTSQKGLRTGNKCSFFGKFGKYSYTSKKVNQYSKSGDFIKTWDSIVDVERELKICQANISACCLGKRKSVGNFIWRYIDDDSEVVYIRKTTSKKVNQYTKLGEFIKTWDSMRDIERELNINNSHISSCCLGKRNTTGGFIFKYYE